MDIKIYEFVAQYQIKDFVAVSVLVNDFKTFSEIDENWLNSRYLGRGLRKLKLVLDERHTKKRQVRLDIEKAKEKYKMFGKKEIDFSDLDEVLK